MPPTVTAPPEDPVTENVNFVDPEIWKVLRNREHPDRPQLEEFFLHLALNHDVAPERRMPQNNGPVTKAVGNQTNITYSASSPDEAALVSAARHFGYFFFSRAPRSVSLRLRYGLPNEDAVAAENRAMAQDSSGGGGTEVRYEILHKLAFSSKRKRSSVIVRRPDGSFVLYCKGADNVILERLCKHEQVEVSRSHTVVKSREQVAQFAEDGLRTLLISKRELTEEFYLSWKQRYEAAALSVTKRRQKTESAMEEVESNLELLGVTGIEDRLQDGVSDAISSLRNAGVKVWVLTGDKVDTAVNIGYACALLTTSMSLW